MSKTSIPKTKAAGARAPAAKAGAARQPVERAPKAAAAGPARKAMAAKSSTVTKVSEAAPVKAKTTVVKAAAAKTTTKAAPAALKMAIAPAATKTAPAPAPAVAAKPISQRHGFKTNEYIVYPAHGVGRILAIEEQEIAGLKLELFVITFEKDKMTLRVPTAKTQSVGMRKLAENDTVGKAMDTLKGRARIKRTMWSRRAQEYEAKINSGDLIAIAEVVRDLYRSESQPEQSYSERQLYEAALDRMAREVAAVDKLDDRGAVQKITEVLARSARGLRIERAAEEGAPSDGQESPRAA